MTVGPTPYSSPLEAARALAPRIRSLADQIEAAGAESTAHIGNASVVLIAGNYRIANQRRTGECLLLNTGSSTDAFYRIIRDGAVCNRRLTVIRPNSASVIYSTGF